jgi:hypothetical protein
MCWEKALNKNKAGDIVVDNIVLAKNLTDKEFVQFVENNIKKAKAKYKDLPNDQALAKHLQDLAETIKLKNSFKFRRFKLSFEDHLLRGDIEIKIIHNNDPKNIRESYSYVTGIGGKNADQIQPPWQVKVEKASGVHMYKYIDGKTIKKIRTIETHILHTGEKVEKVEIKFFIKELGDFYKKKTSTLWPKQWSLEKIKRITQEASENVVKKNRNKYIGISKEGYQVEFFSEEAGVIHNAYLNFDKL